MVDVVVVEAVRSPFGKRNGALSTLHSIDLLGSVLNDVIGRSGIDAAEVGQVVGGCVGQVGMQSMNTTRNAWLAAGLPIDVAATTIDAQCGSSQQAVGMAHALIAAGTVDVAIACGVELMSRVPMGASTPKDPNVGKPINRTYWKHHEFTSQFEGAERVAEKWGITRDDCDAFGAQSQSRALAAWTAGTFSSQIVPIQVPDLDPAGAPLDTSTRMDRDEGLRETTVERLGALKPTGRPNGVHTAGTSSQIADGASAVLLMTRTRAAQLGLEPLATVVDTCLVGCDPVLMLEGPIPVTHKLLKAHGLSITDLDVVEINEAFAAVVLAWQREFDTDLDRVNPNGGAIAHGHPLGATGAALIAKAVHELIRTDGTHALVTMCCGGGLGTGTLLRRG
ncbi:MAG TPA: acetyl-CoA C-acyltransferase [Ilumatobacteraceae bacterium]